jgi:small subunit ribosomal protein S16
MVKIRLKRLGYKRNPIYRIIVINSREKREGRAIAELGFYNPRRKELRLDKAAALEWVKKGAQPTETVQYLIDNCDEKGALIKKVVEVKKLSKKAAAKAEKAAQEAPAKVEAPVAAETPVEETVAEETAAEAVSEEEATA